MLQLRLTLQDFIRKNYRSLRAFSSHCHIAYNTIRDICSGQREPRKSTIKKILRYVPGLDASIFNEENNMSLKTRAEKAAVKHKNVLGAGAKKRKSLPAKSKMKTVMHEWKKGTLHSGSGAIVKSQKQAEAIGFSEARKAGAKIPKKKK